MATGTSTIIPNAVAASIYHESHHEHVSYNSKALCQRAYKQVLSASAQIVIGAASQWQKTIVDCAAVLVLKVIRIY